MLSVNRMFGHNMVLQRDKIIKIWGTGDIGSTIEAQLTQIEISKTNKLANSTTVVDVNGNWFIELPPQDAAFDVSLTVRSGTEELTLLNIGIGEVWIAGGQSNMEYQVHFDDNKAVMLDKLQNRHVRHFNVPRISIPEMEALYNYEDFGVWLESTKDNLPNFSSVAAYFANDIQLNLNIPIGIIGCNWGGTPACAWIEPSYLEGNEGQVWLSEYTNKIQGIDVAKDKHNYINHPNSDTSQPLKPVDGLLGKIMYPGLNQQEQALLVKLTTDEDTSRNPISGGPHHQYRPGGLYQNMVSQIAPYTVRGVIWYQGESDSPHADVYQTVFRQLIKCWRDLWQEELPFLFVQLAPFEKWLAIDGNAFPELRKQQQLVEDAVENTWMVTSGDAGMDIDIHPKIKQPIGQRLALQALNHIYEKDVLSDAPRLLNINRTKHRIEFVFSNADGLYMKGNKVNALLLKDQNGHLLQPEKSYVEKDKLIVEGDVSSVAKIVFATTAYYSVNLFNHSDIPARPFEVTL